ncbi:uncharacterized protein LOC131466443 isoform X1 [Solea solea]|uniref:uncharacterized protein LOC131466443 isoform X1 n=1 Tax=Solea solea TaxID=90069 RepID=UPI0027297F10|nr:uncharacterized protein LOC131466443 isoform X1 [Solea solea]XP_058495653.1 uncharacterized protein LOC131466443 isoform X1 [Solea solea]
MGNCCHAESPCSSAEERSVLLRNDAKATVPTGEGVMEGTVGPDGDDDMRKNQDKTDIKIDEKAEEVKEKQSLENGEMEPSNTQENGPLVKEAIKTAKASPCEGNSIRAQDEEMTDPPDSSEKPGLLQCTLDSLQKTNTATHWEGFPETNAVPEVNLASVQDKIPSEISAESVCPEKPSHTEMTSATQHITVCTSQDVEEEVGSNVKSDNATTKSLMEFSQNGETSLVPNTAAAAAGQVVPIAVVSEKNNEDASSHAVTEDSDTGSCSVCEQAGPEVIKSDDVPESPPATEPTESQSPRLDHNGERRESANSVRESATTALTDAIESRKSIKNGSPSSTKPDQRAEPDPEELATSLKEITSLENIRQDVGEEMLLKKQDGAGDAPKEEEKEDVMEVAVEENTASETVALVAKDAETQEVTWKEEQLDESTATDVRVEVVSVTEKEDSTGTHLENSEEDLYRAAEEVSVSHNDKPGPQCVLETSLLKVEDRCSLAPALDILSYSEREWKGNTAKSALIRKGYREMSQRFSSLRRVRGDNYCALRATLFQVLSHSTQLPSWLQEEDCTMLLEQLEAQEGLISQWTFPGACLQGDGTGDVTQQLKSYMDLLRIKWRAAVDCASAMERQQLCERVFQGGEQEFGLLEALKLLMLGRALELHGCMQGGGDVPLFCWLLFARDSSDCPRSFLSNHLSHVGLSAGLEQVEMFLLGYALQCTIQVYRLYKADTEEFVTYYPDDHKDDWPSVCLVTEDDRHYNVPVVEAAELREELDSS